MARLVSPFVLKRKIPSHPFPAQARTIAERILLRLDSRIAVLVGPCSIHDRAAALDYARRLKALSQQVQHTLFPIMRLFFEKPRTRTGWKGFLYDPHLDGSNDIGAGLCLSRALLLEMASIGVPCATELLDPLASYYLDDLITWGLIGARTSASQPHRQMASRLDFPVGFKNDLLSGRLESAILGILSSRRPHSHLGLDPDGRISSVETKGNPLTHLVLRGSEQGSNYDSVSVQHALTLLREHHLEPRLAIDCAHGNSGKNLERQKIAFASAVEQIALGGGEIAALMLESHLFSGKQSLQDDPSLLAYGVSITDPCLSWEETEQLLYWADEKLSVLPMSMSFVQN